MTRLSCKQVELMLDRSLSAAEHSALDQHVAGCAACAHRIESISEDNKDQLDTLLQADNNSIAMPAGLGRRIETLWLPASVPQTKKPSAEQRRLVLWLVSAAAALAMVFGGWQWLLHGTASLEQRRARHQAIDANPLDRSAAGMATTVAESLNQALELEQADGSEPMRSMVIARDGYLVAETIGAEDEIPLFVVSPATIVPSNDDVL